MSDIEKNMQEALDNIEKDRQYAEELLKDVVDQISKNPSQHQYIGPIAAKYLEGMQRANDQKIKIITVQSKRIGAEDLEEFTEDDAEDLYNRLQKEQDDAR